MIHALCYEYTTVVHSFFEGFGETCFKGGLLPFVLDSPQVVLPGMGDRSFAGIGDNELALGMPSHSLFPLLENLFKSGGVMNMGYPARTLLPMDISERITPGFQFLRDTYHLVVIEIEPHDSIVRLRCLRFFLDG